MKVTYKWFDGRYTQQTTANVEKIAPFKGIDRYKGDDGWYYLYLNGEWKYFGNTREINDYISNNINSKNNKDYGTHD